MIVLCTAYVLMCVWELCRAEFDHGSFFIYLTERGVTE